MNLLRKSLFFLKFLLKKLGLDGAILYTSFFRILQSAGGLVSIIFVAKYLSDVEQGFYYTFGSIIAIQIFFELGLNGIITQYVAHEFSHLKLINSHSFDGEHKYISRVASLLRFSIKWYILFACLLLIVILIVGIYFFNNFYESDKYINWTYPWVLLSIFTSINLLITPIFAFIEGLGKVKEVAKIRLIQQGLVYFSIYCGFIYGFKLYIPALQSFVLAFTGIILIYNFKFHRFLIELLRVQVTEKVDYLKEIFPFQWKIAISWVSGYFIYQLFNPILFAFQGPVVAGQMGMTLAVLNGAQALSNSWMTTKIPRYSALIAQKQYKKLDFLFNTTLKQSILISAIILLTIFISLKISRNYSLVIFGIEIGTKLISEKPILFMILTVFINQFIFSWSIYLRCHKKEPFLFFSIVMALLCSLSVFFTTKYFGLFGMTLGYLLITFSLSFWAYNIFKTKKNAWH